jgi:transposase
MIAGETTPAKLASLADPQVKTSPKKLREALRGRVTKHHRFLVRLHLNQIDALDAAMATIHAQVETNLGPFHTAVELIMSIPGIKNLSAQVIVSEIGIDMSRFLRPHISSSGLAYVLAMMRAPANVDHNRQRKGANWLRPRWFSAL